MAKKLPSVLKNPIFRLALKALIPAVALLWMRSEGAFRLGPSLIFLAAALYAYLKPGLYVWKFAVSFMVLVFAPLFIPAFSGIYEVAFTAIWLALFVVMVGVKDLFIMRRRSAYYGLHIAITVAVAILSFTGTFRQIGLFIIMFLMFREFYGVMSDSSSAMRSLIAAVGAFIVVQMHWITAFLPINFLIGGSLLSLAVFTFHDTVLHHLKSNLAVKIIARNVIIFAVLSLVLLSLPS